MASFCATVLTFSYVDPWNRIHSFTSADPLFWSPYVLDLPCKTWTSINEGLFSLWDMLLAIFGVQWVFPSSVKNLLLGCGKLGSLISSKKVVWWLASIGLFWYICLFLCKFSILCSMWYLDLGHFHVLVALSLWFSEQIFWWTEPLYIHRQSCYLFGRERRVADVPTDHPSCSKQHAVVQFR